MSETPWLNARCPQLSKMAILLSRCRVAVEEAEELEEDRPSTGFGEYVREHHCAFDVLESYYAASDEITEELGRAEDVLGILERDRVERQVDGRLRVAV